MKVASAIDCVSLENVLLDPFKRFTAPYMAERLDSAPDRKLIGAMHAGIPVGLAVVHVRSDSKFALIESIFVDVRFRGKGIGRRLLECAEEKAFEGCATKIEAKWLADASSAHSLQALFECRGWSEPSASSALYRFTGSGIDRFLSNTKTRELPDGFEFFRWKDRTNEDDAAVDLLETKYDMPVGLHPSAEPYMPVDEEKTVGLRWKGEVSGWMLLHRVSEKIIRHTSLWVVPSLAGRGLGISLAAEACRRHRACMGEDDLAFFTADTDNSGMQRFLAKRLHNCFVSISPLQRTMKRRQGSPS